MKERLWPAAGAAFAMHSLVISAFAFGLSGQQGTSPQDLCVEMKFLPNIEKRKGKMITSPLVGPLVGEVADELCEEAGEGNKLIKSKTKGKNFLGAPYPSPDTLHSAPVDLSHKGRGVKRPSSGNENVIPIFNPPPIYPREARLRKIEGIVMIEISLSETGAVVHAKSIGAKVHPLLEGAALKAIQRWKFQPGVRILEVPIEFKLDT